MRRNTFLLYLVLQILVILAVTLIFRSIEDRQVAATIAGTLFVVMPVLWMGLEYRHSGLEKTVWFVGVLQFWTLFALPILGLRLANWGVPFDQLSFLGLRGSTLHLWSSKSYTVMMLLTAWEAWKARKTKKAGL